MRLFLAGGTGFVGGQLTTALREVGHSVNVLTHSRKGAVGEGVELVTGDVTNADSFAASLQGCDAVINLVGIIREFPGRGITFSKLHVQATKNMVDVACMAGVRRYLQMSALGTRAGAKSDYHRSKWCAEEYVRASGLDYTIFRPALIFGANDAFVNMLAGQIRQSLLVPVLGDGSYRLQPIAVEDVARCFALALDDPATIGQTFELCGPDSFSYLELLDLIGTVLGKARVTKVCLPLGVLRLIVPLLQRFPAFPLTLDQMEMLVEGSVCGGEWRSAFPVEPTRFAEGIKRYLV